VLYDLLYKSGYRVHWEQQLKITCDIADAMDYLHGLEPPVIHRDLKSLNCLLDEPVVSTDCEPLVKVADFGMAIRWSPVRKLTRGAGTCHWMAPEVANGTDYEAKADVFSYGMMLWEIFRLDVPFRDRSPSEAAKLLGAGERPEIVQDEFPPECPEELLALMTQCWDHDPENRPSFEQVVETLDKFLPQQGIDDEDFVENAWWRSPTRLGETPCRRVGLDSDSDDEGLVWTRTATTVDTLDRRTGSDSDNDEEDLVESTWWSGERVEVFGSDRRVGLDSDSDEGLGTDACIPMAS
jgi:serine/threonine protein kinase